MEFFRPTAWLDAYLRMCLRNWITLIGASLTTVSALIIIAFVVEAFIFDALPAYAGIVGFLIMPGVFAASLILIPTGVWWDNRKRLKARQEGQEEPAPFPTIDFNDPHIRRTFAIVVVLTLINLIILSTASYQGVVYSESAEFCGLVCHDVMEPEYTAFLDSPHAGLRCAECHIGPGADWFVRSKLSGAWQVVAVALDLYPRPIHTPVDNLRPAMETCEHCHWPEQFTGDRVRHIKKFAEDEENTRLSTVLIMHIGGGNSNHNGIHSWHIDPNKKTEYYATDREREDIVYVRVTELDGNVTEYFAAGQDDFDPATIPPGALRQMDCIDCHNRPTHIFRLPDEAMDRSMARNRISRDLPYIKSQGVEVLEAAAEVDDGPAYIAAELRKYYQESYPDVVTERADELEQAITEIQDIYSKNVFPHMKVTWGTYPNHIGHVTATGCYRCHTDTHRTRGEERLRIRQDCTICHNILAWDEHEPAIIQQLGL